MSDTRFELRSGRKLGVSGFGDPKSRHIVVLCLPPPASGAFNPDPLVTNRHDVHVIVIDRPGYGGSEPLEEGATASVARAADDIVEYLAGIHLVPTAQQPGGVRTVGVVGWGWGGATALSFAARNPALVERLAIVGTPRPSRARRGERAASAAEFIRPRFISSVPMAASSLRINETSPLAALGVADDDPALEGFGVRNRLAELVADRVSEYALGLAWDRLAARDTRWARDLRRVTADSLLLYGDRDPVASPTDGGWYRRHVARSRLVTAQSCGRLAIVSFWDRILQHVAPQDLRPGE